MWFQGIRRLRSKLNCLTKKERVMDSSKYPVQNCKEVTFQIGLNLGPYMVLEQKAKFNLSSKSNKKEIVMDGYFEFHIGLNLGP